MKFVVTTPNEAKAAMEHFNNFHDCFIKSLHLSMTPPEGRGFEYGVDLRYDCEVKLVRELHEFIGDGLNEFEEIELRMSDLSGMKIENVIPYDAMLIGCELSVDDAGAIKFDLGCDDTFVFVCQKVTIH